MFSRRPKVVCKKKKKNNQICLAVAFSGTSTGILNTNFSLFATNASPLLSAAQALWSAYCFPGLGCLLAKKTKTGLPLCCFQRHKCTGILLWSQRLVCLQVMHKATSLLLSTVQSLWNACCFLGLAGLRLFVIKKKQKKTKSVLLLLSAAQLHWNT